MYKDDSRSRSLYDAIGGFGVRLMVMAAPFHYYRFIVGPFHLTVYRIGLTIAALMIVADRAFGVKRRHDAWYRRLLFLGACVVAFEVAQDMRADYAGAFAQMGVILEGVITILVIRAWCTTNARIVTVARTYVLSTAVPVAIALYQAKEFLQTHTTPPLPLTEFFDRWLVQYEEGYAGIHMLNVGGTILPRTASTMVDANFFGIFIAMAMLVTASLMFTRGKRATRLYFASLALMGVTLFASMSRSAWVGIVVGGAYFCARIGARFASKVVISSVVLACAVFVAAGMWVPSLQEDIRNAAFDRATTVRDSAEERRLFAEGAVQAFYDRPFFGVGRRNLIAYSGFPTGHSYYLTRLGEDGIVGAALILGTIAFLGVSAHNESRARRRRGDFILVGITASIVALVVSNLFYDHLIAQENHWVMFGMAAAGITVARCTAASSVPGAASSVGGTTAAKRATVTASFIQAVVR